MPVTFFIFWQPFCYNSSMATVSYVDLTTEQEVPYFKGLTAQDRFNYARVTKKVVFRSKKKVAGLTQKSMLPQVAAAWNLLTMPEKLAWNAAGRVTGFNPTQTNPNATVAGYRLFVQDKCARIRNDLAGNATPSLFHQYYVGNLHIESPATNLKIVQLHPHNYWISKKVKGKKGMYEPVIVIEDFVLPLVISLNYKSELVVAGPSPSARFYAKVWYSYQGADCYENIEVPIDLSADWKTGTATLSYDQFAKYGTGFYGVSLFGYDDNIKTGYIVGYDLYVELIDVTGDLYIDNVKAEHSAQNWVRDTYCNDIDQGFTKAFYQVPDHWVVIDVPDGAWYNSEYKEF